MSPEVTLKMDKGLTGPGKRRLLFLPDDIFDFLSFHCTCTRRIRSSLSAFKSDFFIGKDSK